jgi:ubiquinone/menaquinone biosynthesis C-methylase UbiE
MRDPAIREMRRVLRPGGRVVIIDWQRPDSLAKAARDGLSVVSLLHNLRPGASPPSVLNLEPLMAELGCEDITTHVFGSGVLVAVVGRVDSRTDVVDRAGPESTTPVRSDA